MIRQANRYDDRMWLCKAHLQGGPGGIAIFVGQEQTAELVQRYTAYQKYEVAGAETELVQMYMWLICTNRTNLAVQRNCGIHSAAWRTSSTICISSASV